MRIPLLAGALLVLGGCGKSDFHAPVTSAWSEAGVEAAGLTTTDAAPFGATECVKGKVEKLTAVVCSYPSEEAAKSGATGMEDSLGEAVTRVGYATGKLAVGLADDDGVDLKGQTIAKLLSALAPEEKGDDDESK